MHACTNVKVSRDAKTCEVEVSAELPAEILTHYRAEALKELKRTAEIDGFRKGAAPEELVLKRIGEEALLRRAAEDAVHEELPKLFAAEKLLVIAAPQVALEVPLKDKALSFTAKAPLAPDVRLSDYKTVAAKYPEPEGPFEATDTDAEEALTHLRRERKRIELVEGGQTPEKASEEAASAAIESLPALDDAFAQSIGFKDTADFSASVRTNIGEEKKRRAEDKRRAEMIDAVVAKTEIAMPDIVRQWELDEMEAQFKNDLARAGTNLEAYLGHIGKTRDDVRAGWIETADKRAKTRLVLDAIAAKEAIEPAAEDIAIEVEHLKLHYPSADAGSLDAFVRRSMRTEMTVRFLEGKEPKVPPSNHQH